MVKLEYNVALLANRGEAYLAGPWELSKVLARASGARTAGSAATKMKTLSIAYVGSTFPTSFQES